MSAATPLLEAKNLEKHFTKPDRLLDTVLRRNVEREVTYAVDDLSFTLERKESKGIIGESGCGKTTLLKTLLGLYQPDGGDVFYKGEPISDFSPKEWKRYRRNVQIIFQDPYNSLDPKMTVRTCLLEPLKIHSVDDEESRLSTVLERVQLSPAEKYLSKRPTSLSGGERQRVSIARALILEPEVILADEPVSMLDVSTQAAILNLLQELADDLDMSVLYISHDLSTVSYLCERTLVMYLGQFVEKARTRDLIEDPQHPYTRALIDAIPSPNPHTKRKRTTLTGGAATLTPDLRQGCRFRNRCEKRMGICDSIPPTVTTSDGREVGCYLYAEQNNAPHPVSDGGTE